MSKSAFTDPVGLEGGVLAVSGPWPWGHADSQPGDDSRQPSKSTGRDLKKRKFIRNLFQGDLVI
jgi:hypothetical protein